MSFKYSAFFSYRHTLHKEGAETQQKIIESLQFELSTLCDLPAYQDQAKLQAGDAFNMELATSLCQSAVLVCLYWPTYFSLKHPYCAQEFKGMEKLERKRLGLLLPQDRSKKLIVFLALRGASQIPEEIRNTRQCIDLQDETLDPNMEKRRGYKTKIRLVAEAIAERYSMLSDLEGACDGCHTYCLPALAEIEPWLREISQVSIKRTFPLTE
jgi:hypothetical protein